jgi:hypothetical protein
MNLPMLSIIFPILSTRTCTENKCSGDTKMNQTFKKEPKICTNYYNTNKMVNLTEYTESKKSMAQL